MRSNGLTASAYTPVADLDPRIADALLSDLKEQGIAAYTKPVESTSAGGFDRPEFRVKVQDRLYVDAHEADRVTALISEQDPTLVTTNDDLTWAQIVAGFDQPLERGLHPWPDTEDLERPAPPDDHAGHRHRNDATPAPETGESGETGNTTDHGGPDEVVPALRRPSSFGPEPVDDEPVEPAEPAERFVPPTPPPLPRLEPWQQVAWVGLIGGPLLLLVAVLFSLTLPRWLTLIAVVGFMGGFITLVATMKGPSDPDDDPDHGAVV